MVPARLWQVAWRHWCAEEGQPIQIAACFAMSNGLAVVSVLQRKDVSITETPLERSFRFANLELEKKTAKMILHVYNDAKKGTCQPGHFRRVGSPLLLAIA